MAGDPNLYDELEAAIARVRFSLPSDDQADRTDPSAWSTEDQQELAELTKALAQVNLHRSVRMGVVPHVSGITECAACDETRPCSVIRRLATEWHVWGEGFESEAKPKLFSYDDAVRDRVGVCACGLAGRQKHMLVSPHAVEPQQYVRTKWECTPTRPGPHIRLG